jgi:hypothetical protein
MICTCFLTARIFKDVGNQSNLLVDGERASELAGGTRVRIRWSWPSILYKIELDTVIGRTTLKEQEDHATPERSVCDPFRTHSLQHTHKHQVDSNCVDS